MNIPRQLRRWVERRQCVAFVGAGFSSPAGMPGWGKLLDRLLDIARDAQINSDQDMYLEGVEEAIKRYNYAMAVQQIEQIMTRADLDQAIARQFSMDVFHKTSQGDQERMLDRMRCLVTAPWAGIITTNYDELVEQGLGRFYKGGHPSQGNGNDIRLGNVLSIESHSDLFFVKLHGSVAAGGYVLGTEEYDRTYVNTPQVSTFLSALMLRYHIVFVGCSLEDEVLRLRRRLCFDYQGHIPTSYALLPNNLENRSRQFWLKDNAQIETLLYDAEAEGEPAYWAVDEFLRDAETLAVPNKSPVEGFVGKTAVRDLNDQPLNELISKLGQLNNDLLYLLWKAPEHALMQHQIDNQEIEGIDEIKQALLELTTAERFYRIMYLIRIGLVEEDETADGGRLFRLTREAIRQFC
ncbi:SIR2 family protein [Neptuniibacter sp.]|uniref:SIR2 family protein n=1 Tax=Neptuniibacter sp. TaxID=1962643 RepID=UPI00261144E3|nr:SIR2 family protein [Neptuniibacter sp.]MCP4597275.1 hypothetical protein [Neptuniibacter sp.]